MQYVLMDVFVINVPNQGFFFNTYSNVPNRRVGQNKRAGQIPIHMQEGINVQKEFFLKNNKRADQNKAVQGRFFLKIDKHACTSIR